MYQYALGEYGATVARRKGRGQWGCVDERRSHMVEVEQDVSVRPLKKGDLSEADRIMRLAFGTFLGLPEPMTFMGDAGYVRTRWLAAPDAAFGAEVDGKLVGSNFATNWGSVGFFGPLTVEPALWNKGIGSRLMEPVEECFDNWGTRHEGLFTWSQDRKSTRLNFSHANISYAVFC